MSNSNNAIKLAPLSDDDDFPGLDPVGDGNDPLAAFRREFVRFRALRLGGDYREALEVANQVLERAVKVGVPIARAEAMYHLGAVQLARADASSFARAQETLLQALDLAKTVRCDELQADIWCELMLLATRYHEDMTQARTWARFAQASAELVPGDGTRRSRALMFRGLVFYRDRDFPRAEAVLRQALDLARRSGVSPLALADHLHALGNTLEAMNQDDEAREVFESAMALRCDEFGHDHPMYIDMAYDVASFYRRIGEFNHAREWLIRVLDTRRALYGEIDTRVGDTHRVLANLEQEAGNLGVAEAHARDSLEIYVAKLKPVDHRIAGSWSLLAIIQFRRGRFSESIASYETALAIRLGIHGPNHPSTLLTELNLAEAHVALADAEERRGGDGSMERYKALQIVAKVMRSIADRLEDPGHQDLRILIGKIRGLARLGAGDVVGALEPLEQALEILEGSTRLPSERAEVQWALARALRSAGDRESKRSRGLAEAARDFYQGQGEAGRNTYREITIWLEDGPG